ncbi:hypothetical protein FCG40_06370 [Fimbriimonadia bacterium ATM]|nr:hypothetical protein [Armatimonadota bacterium]MCE7900719.1 hypothetical protein [Armatimonadetes bacterium ATM1]MDL1928599.1 hypothetical protein [Fimbriimonadia bacterium ATM]RIJ96193.1 MAG: hypothetical protein DCC45_08040 [Armatimonadota bacterium]
MATCDLFDDVKARLRIGWIMAWRVRIPSVAKAMSRVFRPRAPGFVPMLCLLLALAPTLAEAQVEKDRRLDAVVSVRSNAGTIKSVLESVSKATGVELRVAPPLDDDLVILVCKNRKASDVLKKLSDHFDWSWVREGDAYRLIQTKEQADKEKAELREQILAPYRELKRIARRDLEGFNKIDPKEAEKELGRLREEAMTSRDPGAAMRRMAELERALSPADHLVYDACANLTDAEFEALERDGRIILSTRPKMGQFKIPASESRIGTWRSKIVAGIARQLKRAEETGAPLTEKMRQYIGEELDGVRLVVTSGGNFDGESIATTWKVALESAGVPHDINHHAWLSVGGMWSDPESGQAPVPDFGAAGDVPIDRAWIEPYLSRSETGVSRLQITLPIYRSPGSPEVEPLSGLAEFLTDVFDRANKDLILDGHDRLLDVIQSANGGMRNLGMLLHTIHSEMPIRMTEQDGWVLLRSQRRAFERSRNIPRRILFQSIAREEAESGRSLDHWIWLATSLNDRQMANTLLVREDLGVPSRYGLRLLGEMAPPARRALLEGESYPYLALSQKGKEMFRQILVRSAVLIGPQFAADEETRHMQYASRLWYGVESNPQPPTVDITDAHPFGIPAEAYVSAASFSYSGAAVRSTLRERSQAVSFYGPGMLANVMSAPRSGTEGPTQEYALARMDELLLSCHASENFVRGVRLSSKARVSEFGAYEALPESLRKTVADLVEKYRQFHGGGATEPTQ